MPFFRSKPDKTQTMAREYCYRLSGGAQQRITVGRLPLDPPRNVTLNDATAALGSTSEAAV